MTVGVTENPWALRPSDYDDAWQTRRNAISAGLRAYGYHVSEDEGDPYYGWPEWAVFAYHAFPASQEVRAVRVLAEGAPELQDAVEAAYQLGGGQAVSDLLSPLLESKP